MLTALLVLACELPQGPAATDVAARVQISPKGVALLTNQTVDFSVAGLTAAGDTVMGMGMQWTVSGGSVLDSSASGGVHHIHYRSGTSLGSYRIVAKATNGSLADTATVTVNAVPVAAVVIAPATATVAVGQTAQLGATAQDSAGGALSGRTITWTVTDTATATVNASGLVTGKRAGSTTVTASSASKSGTATITVTNVPVAAVTVSPATASLTVGQTTQLTATARDSAGGALAGRPITWTTSDTTTATVSATGLVTGKRAGAATITASTAGKSGSAGVTVANAPVATVVISPRNPAVASGQTVQLSAAMRDANGNLLTGRVITWVSRATSVATVNGSGLVGGVAAGSAVVIATSESKTDSVTVTVSTSSGGGGTILFQENFEDTGFAGRGWYDNPGMAITTAQHIPGSTAALEIHFTPGASQPTWGGVARRQFTGSATMYLSFWVKYSSNWIGSGTPDHPHEFEFLTNEEAAYAGPAYTHLSALVEDNYQNGGVPRVSLVDGRNIDEANIGVNLTNLTENRASQGCNGNTDGYSTDCYDNGGYHNNGKIWNASQPFFLPNPGPGYKGDWHFVEVYFQLNSIQNGKGVTDGIVRYWVDGQLAIEHTNVLFRTGAHATMQFNQFLIAPYIGVGSPVDQTMWVDNLTIATSKP